MIYHLTGIFQAGEQFTVEKLIAKTAVEALYVAILPRASFGNKQRLYACTVQPPCHRPRHKLRSIVASEMLGGATYGKQIT